MATLSDELQNLINQYNSVQAYTPKTADQIRTQAEGEFESLYDQRRRSAQQQYERNDLALQRQLSGLGRTYDKAREASIKDYKMRYSNAGREQLRRGLQRSSYAAQTLANIDLAGAEAQNELWERQNEAEGQINEQQTQLASQLADQLAGFDADQAADVLNRIRQLEDQEYERGVTNQQMKNSLSTQIYQFIYQAERDKVADQQWQKQFDESVRQYNESKAKKSGGGGSSAKKKTQTTNTKQQNTLSAYDQIMQGANNKGTTGNNSSFSISEKNEKITTPSSFKLTKVK
jgi:hypothetical protein